MTTFSFIIPVKPGGYVAALDSLRQLEADASLFEIFIAEGCSPSRQRNTAAQMAQGEILYFIDDDSHVASDCLCTCTTIMSDSSVATAGGPSLTPKTDSLLQQLFGKALSSIYGAGAVRNRYRAFGVTRVTTDKELILCNLAIRREVFLAAGGLDERLYPNEENELLDRICATGQKLVHAPELAIHRSQRKTLWLFIRQMYSYGRGRAQQTLIAGPGTIIGFAPLLFVCHLLLIPILPFGFIRFIPLFAYLTLDILFTITAVSKSRPLSFLLLFFIFPLMHISNGIGLLSGLLGGKAGTATKCTTEEIVVRKIKTFEQSTW
jgi:GT2 family glycosyltransferase